MVLKAVTGLQMAKNKVYVLLSVFRKVICPVFYAINKT